MASASIIAAIIGGAVAITTTVASGIATGVQSAEANETAKASAAEQKQFAERQLKMAESNAAWERKFQYENATMSREGARQARALQAKEMKKEEFKSFADRLTKRAATDIQFKEATWALWGK